MKKNYENNRKDINTGSFPTRTNLVIIGFGCLLIIIGFCLMSGNGTPAHHFAPAIFSLRRIAIAPRVALVGFVCVGIGILYRPFRPSIPAGNES